MLELKGSSLQTNQFSTEEQGNYTSDESFSGIGAKGPATPVISMVPSRSTYFFAVGFAHRSVGV